MAEVKRVIWIVLDSVGIGELPDADKFGDVGSNTLCNTAKAVGGLKIPNMVQLGIGNIAGITGIEKCEQPKGCYGRLAEISNGKDTTIGHWEMTGIYSPDPFPVYPDGFPQEVIEPFIKETGVSGILGNAGQANYAASKAGVIGLTKTMARELGSRGITVNAIAPGFVDTEMTGVLSEEIRENACRQIILGRFGKPEDIANVAVFLASDKADYITGQVISVDGGMNV